MRSRRHQILDRIVERLEAISTVAGFETDAGAVVHFGETPDLSDADPDAAIVVVAGDEEPRYQGEHVFLKLPILIFAVAKANLDEPWQMVESLVADVKRAVELEDRQLGMHEDPTKGPLVPFAIERGPVKTLPREPGSLSVGVALTYFAPYPEVWGAP